MKKRYFRKILCFVLAFLMTASLFTSSMSASPQTQMMSRIVREAAKRYKGRQIELTINDMKFIGRVYNTDLTDNKIDDLVKEVMREMGLDAKDIDDLHNKVDKMLEALGFSAADFAQFKSDIITLAGTVPLGGDIASIIFTIIELLGDNTQGASDTLGDMLKDKGLSGGLDLGLGPEIGGKVSNGFSWAGAGNVTLEALKRHHQKWQSLVDGLNAARDLSNFHNKVDEKINKFCDNHKDKNILHFDGATAKKTFTLYGGTYTEEWSLDMGLRYKRKLTSNHNVHDGYFAGR